MGESNEKMRSVTEIRYPNTVKGSEQISLRADKGFSFREIMKSGEMSGICWIEVLNHAGHTVAEIKESVCDIYYGDII